ncbi:MAG: glycosyltransferase family 4 protein [Pyrinomonadaceae bacterium]
MIDFAGSAPKIAWLSPLPPQRSGVANYSYRLVKALKPRLEIDLYCDTEAPPAELQNEFDVFPLSAFVERRHVYDEAIYHVGNHSGFHREIYRLAWDFPGTVVLHDYDLSHFMYDSFYGEGDRRLYGQALLEGYGAAGLEEHEAIARGVAPDVGKFPMSHALVRRSKKVVVHHRWVRDQLGGGDRIEVIPHFAELNCRPTREQIGAYKNRFQLKDGHFVVSCLGFVNGNKLPRLLTQVVRRLIDDGYPVQLVFAGEPAPEARDLEQEVRSGSYSQQIIFTGYQTESDYFSAICASDVIVNLRNPSMGEASGTLMHALAAAKSTIVSDINQYREFPDNVCWKLTHDENQAETLYAYLGALLSDRSLRAAMSHSAAEYVRSVLATEKVIARWVQLLSGRDVG